MSKRTYICIDCRISKRAEADGGLINNLKCPHCNKKLWELEWRWRIPKKTDDKAWKELEKKVKEEAEEWIPRREELGFGEIRDLERKINHYEQSKDIEFKQKKIRQLQNQIERVRRKYIGNKSTLPFIPANSVLPPLNSTVRYTKR